MCATHLAVGRPSTEMSVCETCGGTVTSDFARVMGDNQNRVYRCPGCVSATGG